MIDENKDRKVVLKGIREIGNIEDLWNFPQEKLPKIDGWGDSDLCWICYWVEDFGIALNIAIYNPHKKGSGWSEMNTLKRLPAPIAWTPVIVPERYFP